MTSLTTKVREKSSFVQNRYPALYAELSSVLQKDAKILSYGCGMGAELIDLHKHMPEASLTGVDIHPWALKQTRKNAEGIVPELRLIVLEDFLKQPETFDAVFAMNVFKRMEEGNEYPFEEFCDNLRDVSEFVRPGGFLFLDGTQYAFTDTPVFKERFNIRPLLCDGAKNISAKWHKWPYYCFQKASMDERKWLTFGRIAYCYLEKGVVHKIYRPFEGVKDLLPDDPQVRAQIESIRINGLSQGWTPAHRKLMFGREVSKLAAVLGNDDFPQLLSARTSTLEMRMTYAGPDILEYDGPVPSFDEMLPRIKSMYQCLKEAHVPFQDVHPANICWDGKKLRLIDFSWGDWKDEPETKRLKNWLSAWRWALRTENRERQRRERAEWVRTVLAQAESG